MQSGKLNPAVSIGLGILAVITFATAAMRRTESFKAPPPKPYELAMYDVYSDLLQAKRSWWEQLIDPRPEAILIRTETKPGQNHQVDLAFVEASLVPEKRLKPAVDLAIADYVKRNSRVVKLQRDFNLPTYDLISELEEQALLEEHDPSKEDSACRAFHRKYPGYDRWVELSAVGFNQEQTVAVVYLAEWRASDASCRGGISGHGGYQMLQKRGGKWYLINNQVFSEWIS